MKRYSVLIALVAAVILGGCRRDQNTSQTNAAPTDLRVNAGVKMVSSENSFASSRAGVVTGAAFNDNSQINVILVDADPAVPTTDYAIAAPYVCAVSGTAPDEVTTWSPLNPLAPLMVRVALAKVLAHYPSVLPSGSSLSADKRTLNIALPAEIPYGELGDLNFNAVAINIPALASQPEVWFVKGDEDYMVGVGGNTVTSLKNPDDGSLQNSSDIAMQHALSMVVVQIKMSADHPEKSANISGLSIENVDAATGPLRRGAVDIATNVFTPNETRLNYSRPMSKFPSSGNYYFGMMTYPSTIAATGDVLIKCSVGAGKYTYKVPAVEWKPGLVYLYSLTLTPASGVLGADVQVVDWPTAIKQDITLD